VSKIAPGNFVEHRAYPRQAINLDASFSCGNSRLCYCVIRDFCAGGLFFTFSELDPNLKKIKFDKLHRGDEINIEVLYRGKKLIFDTRLVRLMENGMGVAFPIPDPPQLAPFWDLAKSYSEQSNAPKPVIKDPKVREAITRVSEIAKQKLLPLVDKCLATLQDRLLAAAERPSSDAEQHPFFDAMAMVERNRVSLRDQFITKVTDGLLQTIQTPSKDGNGDDFTSQLSIIDKEEFEDWLIVKVMISKAEIQYRDLLLQLQLRLDEMLGCGKNRVDNPLSPAALCNVYRSFVHTYSQPVKIERMFYKAFENEVVTELESLYVEFNALLVQSGVLPDLSASKIAQRQNEHLLRKTGAANAESSEAASQEQEKPESSADGAGANGEGADMQAEMPESPHAVGQESPSRVVTEAQVEQLGSQHSSLRAHRAEGRRSQAIFSATQDILKLRRSSAPSDSSEGYDTYAASQLVNDASGTAMGTGSVGVTPHFQLIKGAIPQYEKVMLQESQRPVEDPFQPGALRVTLSKLMAGLQGNWRGFSSEEDESLEVIDRLINSILANPRVVDDVKPYLNKMRLPLFKLLVEDSEFLVEDHHPARQVLNQLANLGMVEGLLTGQSHKIIEGGVNHIVANFDAGLGPFNHLLRNLDRLIEQQQKIYQANINRLEEACKGQETIEVAKKTVEEAIDGLFQGRRVPMVVPQFLEAGWRDLMRLSLLRKGAESNEWRMALQVIEDLLNHFEHPEGEHRVAAPALLKMIEPGLEKSNSNTAEITDVVSKLERLLIGKAPSEEWFDWGEKQEQSAASKEQRIEAEIAQDQHLQKWYRRVQRAQVGDWVRFIIDARSAHRVRIAWRSDKLKRLVFVTKQGLKYRELAMIDLAKMLAKRRAILVAEEDLPVVDQGLESMVQQIYEQLAHESTHDQLTGLFNRKEFERQVGLAIKEARTGHREYCLAFYDINQFKVVNANAGSKAGDELLKQLAAIIGTGVNEQTIIARLGDCEFGFLMPDANEQKGYSAADKHMTEIRDLRFEWNNAFFRVGVSIGVMALNEECSSVSQVIKAVESCALAAKEAGGNRIHHFQADDQELERRRSVLDWVSKVNRAIEDDWLLLRAQRIEPIGRSGNGEELKPKYEILLSIRDEAGKDVTPLDFVRAAEKYNRMQVVDQWVISHVFQWMRENPDKVNELECLSINLSGHSLNDERLMKFIFEEFSSKGIPRDKVCFEVTETIAVTNLTDAEDFIKEMQKLGCRFSLDDFGTGMSSYAYLKYLPVDYLKIDGSFVKHIAEDEKDFAMVKSMNEMAHVMGKKTIAEFVASNEILEKLVEIGVDYAQGFYVEKPILLDDLH
jgi:diguanylate cyclase (GGDEF)-like protein